MVTYISGQIFLVDLAKTGFTDTPDRKVDFASVDVDEREMVVRAPTAATVVAAGFGLPGFTDAPAPVDLFNKGFSTGFEG